MPQEDQVNIEQTPETTGTEESYDFKQELGDVFDRMTTEAAPSEEPQEEVQEEVKEEQASPEEGEESAGDVDNEVSSTPSGQADPAPTNMPYSIKQEWDNLSPEVREAITEHENKTGAKMSELGLQISRTKPLSETIDKLIEQHPQFKDSTPEQIAQGAAQLAAVQVQLDQNPLKTIIDIANSYGVLPQLQQSLSGEKPTDDQSTIMQLQQQVAGLERQLQGQVQQPQNLDNLVDQRLNEREAADLINNFAAQNELFTEVEDHIPNFLVTAQAIKPNATQEELLQTAYDMAINALPGIRAREQATEAGVTTPGTAEQPNSKQRTVKAAKAAAINVKSNNRGEPPVKSQKDMMGDAWDRMMNS